MRIGYTKSMYTQIVIQWLREHEYSRQHWETVANEMRDKAKGDREKAIILLAEALEDFHHKYRDAVVKENNLLHTFISLGYHEVNWKSVASTWYPDKP